MVRSEQPVTLRKQHAGAGVEGVVDPPRPLHRQPLRVGIASRIHIGVTHLAPEMRRAFLHRTHEFRDAQRIGQPFELDAVLLFEFEEPLVRDERVRALVVGVDAYAGFPSRSLFDIRVPSRDRQAGTLRSGMLRESDLPRARSDDTGRSQDRGHPPVIDEPPRHRRKYSALTVAIIGRHPRMGPDHLLVFPDPPRGRSRSCTSGERRSPRRRARSCRRDMRRYSGSGIRTGRSRCRHAPDRNLGQACRRNSGNPARSGRDRRLDCHSPRRPSGPCRRVR